MRIALVVTGGVDASARDKVIPSLLSLIERVAQAHELHVFALRYLPQPTSYSLLGATVHDLGSPLGIRRQYAALRAAMRRLGRFDLIHGYWALPSGLVATMVGRRSGIPSVVTFDSGEFVGFPDIGYGAQLALRQRLAVRASARLATARIVCTTYQQRLASACGISATVIPIGAEPRLFGPPAARADGPPWRLLHVGSINRVKDHATLLRAFRRLIDQDIDAYLDIVGEDTMHGAIQALSSSLALGDRVTFHGSRAHDELAPYYQRAHALVLSSRHEAAAVVVLEAALCALPVVGSAVGYVADWAPTRAVCVPPHDPQALASALADLLGDGERRRLISAAAESWALERNADRTTSQLLALYDELCQPPG